MSSALRVLSPLGWAFAQVFSQGEAVSRPAEPARIEQPAPVPARIVVVVTASPAVEAAAVEPEPSLSVTEMKTHLHAMAAPTLQVFGRAALEGALKQAGTAERLPAHKKRPTRTK